MKRSTSIATLAVTFSLLVSFDAWPRIHIDIDQVSDHSFPIAITPLVRNGGNPDSKSLGEKFAKLVQTDLERMKLFRFIDRKAYLEDVTKLAYRPSDIHFPSWIALDALALTKGWYRVKRKRVTFELYLYDVLGRKKIFKKRYKGKVTTIPRMAHRFADDIIHALTGETGIFDTRIAFIGQKKDVKELYVMDSDGANLEKLTTDQSIVLSPAWARDGESIYYVSFKKKKAAQLFQYKLKRRKGYQKTHFQSMVIGIELDPAYRLLATTLAEQGNSEIYLLTYSGKKRIQLTKDRNIDVSPSFSPNGEQIAFVSDRGGSAQIYRMNRDGTNTTRLTFKGLNNTSPAWSPRGDKILFSGMDDDGHFDIFSMKVDGSGLVRLTYDSRNNEDPSWAPNGQHIVFTSSRSGQHHLYSMKADGSHQRKLTRGPWKHYMPSWSPKRR